MTVFIFLTLGRDEEAYGFMLWWLKNPGEPVDLEYKKLVPGQWQREENPDKFEDLFERYVGVSSYFQQQMALQLRPF